jgi:serine protease Do
LKEGDVILDYNGQPVEGREQLARMVQETPVGRQVKIGVWRNGASQTLTATVEAGNARAFVFADGNNFVMPEVRIPPMPPIDIPRMQTIYRNPALGIYGESLGEKQQLAEFFGVKEGVLVTEVLKDSAAEKAGIKAGDVITKVDDNKVSTTRDITNTLRGSRSKKTVTVTVIRSKKEMSLPVTIEAAVSGAAIKAHFLTAPDTDFPEFFQLENLPDFFDLDLKFPAPNRVI